MEDHTLHHGHQITSRDGASLKEEANNAQPAKPLFRNGIVPLIFFLNNSTDTQTSDNQRLFFSSVRDRKTKTTMSRPLYKTFLIKTRMKHASPQAPHA